MWGNLATHADRAACGNCAATLVDENSPHFMNLNSCFNATFGPFLVANSQRRSGIGRCGSNTEATQTAAILAVLWTLGRIVRPAASSLLDILPADSGRPSSTPRTLPLARLPALPLRHPLPRRIHLRGSRYRSTSMRLIVGITFLLIGIGMFSCSVEGTANSRPQSPTSWVRTVDGWERPNLWHTSPAEPPGSTRQWLQPAKPWRLFWR